MDLRLKKITLKNFKGCRDREIDFNTVYSVISGPNESGKSTVMDAFVWCLFGKDSKDRTDFNIKTLDANGNVIERIAHEVTCLFDVKDISTVIPQTVELKRCYTEKWTKKRGAETEEFTGHEVERFYNGVPCTEKDFKQKIEDIIPENIFKLITNPLYFPSLKKDQQRSILLSMVGGISNEEIAKGNKDFQALLDMLFGKTLEEYKREIGAKKKRVKDELAGIPDRIDEVKRGMPETLEWEKLDSEKNNLLAEVQAIDEQLGDINKSFEAHNKEKQKMQSSIFEIKQERAQFINKIETDFLADFYKYKAEYQKTVQERLGLKEQLKEAENVIAKIKTELENDNLKRNKLIDEWKFINGELLIFNENDFSCPTCGANFEPSKIDAKQAEMTARFNEQKAKRLAENQSNGIATKKSIESLTASLIEWEEKHKTLTDTIASFEPIDEPKEPNKANIDFSKYTEITDFDTLISELEKELQKGYSLPDTAELIDKKRLTQNDIHNIVLKLSTKAIIDSSIIRISELEKQLKTLNHELANLEKTEFTIMEFSKAKITSVEKAINSLFTNVKFKLFENQINGAEVETCEALVKGVPFSDANSAGKINAGLDIINAISKHHNAFAPIFIDNAEGCNKIMQTNSQQITMQVTGSNTEFSVN